MTKAFCSVLIILLVVATSGCVRSNKAYIFPAKVDLSKPELGLTVKSVDAGQYGNHSGKKIEKFLLVTQVKKGMPAEKMGVLAGDLLHTIDQQPVTGIRDSYEILQTCKDTQSITLGVFRNGELLNLTSKLKK